MPGQRFVSFGWLWDNEHAQSDASGAATLYGPVVEIGHQHAVDRIIIEADSVALGECRMYRSDVMPSRFVDGSATAATDTWEAPAPFILSSTEQLVFSFTGLDPFVAVRVSIHYEDQAIVLVPVDPTLLRISGP